MVLYQEANGALSEPLRPTSPTWNATIVRSDCAVALPTTGGLRQNKNTRLMIACSRLRAQSGVRGTWLVSTRKILVVEDGYLFAEEIAANLRGFGMEPVGPVGHLDEACRMAREKAVDGAVLES